MKRFLMGFSTLLIAGALHAQLFSVGNVGVGYLYVGPKLGGNVSTSTLDVGAGIDKKMNLGYQFGAVAKLGITEKLSIQPELVYTSKGYGTDASGFEAHSNYQYFGLPVVAKYAFMKIAGVQVYGAGGFYTDYLTKVTYVMDNFSEEATLDTYNRFDFGLNFGGGANIPLDNGDQLNLDLAFTLGLTDVDDSGVTSSSKNITVQLSAIYLVDLTKWISFKGKSQPNDGYEENEAPAGGSKVERE